jgi:hypothetical protein
MPRCSAWTPVALLVLALPTAWTAERDPTWTITPIAQVVLRDEADGLHLQTGRIAVTIPDGSAPCVLVCDPFCIELHSAMLIIERQGSHTFVAVIAGSALIRDQRSGQRGLLLQPRQGVGGGRDGSLSDILTFARLPRADDALALDLQAESADDGTPWPTSVPEVPLVVALAPAPPSPMPAKPPPLSGERSAPKAPPISTASSMPIAPAPGETPAIFEPQRVAPFVAMPTGASNARHAGPSGIDDDAIDTLPAWLRRDRR